MNTLCYSRTADHRTTPLEGPIETKFDEDDDRMVGFYRWSSALRRQLPMCSLAFMTAQHDTQQGTATLPTQHQALDRTKNAKSTGSTYEHPFEPHPINPTTTARYCRLVTPSAIDCRPITAAFSAENTNTKTLRSSAALLLPTGAFFPSLAATCRALVVLAGRGFPTKQQHQNEMCSSKMASSSPPPPSSSSSSSSSAALLLAGGSGRGRLLLPRRGALLRGREALALLAAVSGRLTIKKTKHTHTEHMKKRNKVGEEERSRWWDRSRNRREPYGWVSRRGRRSLHPHP